MLHAVKTFSTWNYPSNAGAQLPVTHSLHDHNLSLYVNNQSHRQPLKKNKEKYQKRKAINPLEKWPNMPHINNYCIFKFGSIRSHTRVDTRTLSDEIATEQKESLHSCDDLRNAIRDQRRDKTHKKMWSQLAGSTRNIMENYYLLCSWVGNCLLSSKWVCTDIAHHTAHFCSWASRYNGWPTYPDRRARRY